MHRTSKTLSLGSFRLPLSSLAFAIAAGSGVIGGAVTSVTFAVAAGDRVAGKTGAAATFTFTPTTGGAGPASVTLNYPSGFFATSATPTATSSSAGTSLTPQTPGGTSVVLSVTGTALSAGAAVTVTLAGCTLGPARAAGDMTVQTSGDPTASSAVSSGVVGGAVTSVHTPPSIKVTIGWCQQPSMVQRRRVIVLIPLQKPAAVAVSAAFRRYIPNSRISFGLNPVPPTCVSLSTLP